MIRRLKYHEIDFEKYDECVLNSEQSRIYAESWYLDAVTNKKWECLVYGDYEAVMPISYSKKIGIKIIVQPLICQQLGIFSKDTIGKYIYKKFIAKLNLNIIHGYNFNENNTENLTFKDSEFSQNHILSLNKPYQEIFENFKKDRVKDIRRIGKKKVLISDQFDFEVFKNELCLKYPLLSHIYNSERIRNLVHAIQENERMYYRTLLSDDHIISQILIAKSNNRNYLLFSSRDTNNEFKGAFTYLLNNFIKDNSEKNEYLDFEGSTNFGIAKFNESFGAIPVNYNIYTNIKMMKKITNL